MKIKSSLVWNKKEMAEPCRLRRPWGQKYVYNFNKHQGSNRGVKIFCFSIFDRQIKLFVRSKFVTELSFQVELIKQREMKGKIIAFYREHFDDTSGRLIISL